MIVRDLFTMTDTAAVIARALFEDQCSPKELDGWIKKYYAQIQEIERVKARRYDGMLYFSTLRLNKERTDWRENDCGFMYPVTFKVYDHSEPAYEGVVSGFSYEDIQAGRREFYGIEGLTAKQFANLYVPDYTIFRFGLEVVASEALREYGWNGHDPRYMCPRSVKEKVLELLPGLTSELEPINFRYYERCRNEFLCYCEGRLPRCYEKEAREAEGWNDRRSALPHALGWNPQKLQRKKNGRY